jgi:hypothetical protein
LSGVNQCAELVEDIFDGVLRKSTQKRRFACLPVQTLDLIRKDGSFSFQPFGNYYLKGVAFDFCGDWAKKGKANLSVVWFRRQHYRRPVSGLLVSSLWGEGYPDNIATFGAVGWHYHTS